MWRTADASAARLLKRQYAHSEAFHLLASASEQDLVAANRRFDLVKRHLGGEKAPHSIPARTLRLWVAQYRLAKEQYGNGYVGLLGKTSKRGNRTSRLPEESRDLLIQFIENDYENLRQKTKIASWAALKRKCDERGIEAPSYVTFCVAVRERADLRTNVKAAGATRRIYPCILLFRVGTDYAAPWRPSLRDRAHRSYRVGR